MFYRRLHWKPWTHPDGHSHTTLTHHTCTHLHGHSHTTHSLRRSHTTHTIATKGILQTALWEAARTHLLTPTYALTRAQSHTHLLLHSFTPIHFCTLYEKIIFTCGVIRSFNFPRKAACSYILDGFRASSLGFPKKTFIPFFFLEGNETTPTATTTTSTTTATTTTTTTTPTPTPTTTTTTTLLLLLLLQLHLQRQQQQHLQQTEHHNNNNNKNNTKSVQNAKMSGKSDSPEE